MGQRSALVMPFVAEECQMPGGNDVFATRK